MSAKKNYQEHIQMPQMKEGGAYIKIMDMKKTIYKDQTGRFKVTSSKCNKIS